MNYLQAQGNSKSKHQVRLGFMFLTLPSIVLLILILFLSGCKSGFLKIDNDKKLDVSDEFKNAVKISEIKDEKKVTDIAVSSASTAGNKNKSEQDHLKSDLDKAKQEVNHVKSKKDQSKKITIPNDSNKSNIGKKTKKLKSDKNKTSTEAKLSTDSQSSLNQSRQPDLEDNVGFSGRRPIVDPFRVGEKVIHNVNYFKVSAGELTLAVEPFVEVNGRKSYSFITEIKSSSMFSSFYSVDDRVVALADFETLIPWAFTMSVKESGQLREGRSAFDFTKNQATYWEKKYTKKNGLEEKKQNWEILPYSQSVFTAIFYMRNFSWEVGKEYAFRVADDEENIIFKAKTLRKEKLKTEIGDFPSIVVKPEFMVKGAFKPVGDIYIWLSDDDRKYVLRIESNIKIGTLVSEVVKIEPGN